MKHQLQQQALEVIETIVSSDNKRLTNKQRQAIYRFAHCALGKCGNPHHEWVMELKQLHEYYGKNNIL